MDAHAKRDGAGPQRGRQSLIASTRRRARTWLETRYDPWRERLGAWLRPLRPLQVPAFVNIAVLVLLLGPRQSRDAVKVLAEDAAEGPDRMLLMLLLAVGLALLSSWIGRMAITDLNPKWRRWPAGPRWVAATAPMFLSILPLLAVAIAFFRTSVGEEGASAGWWWLAFLVPVLVWVFWRGARKNLKWYSIVATGGLVWVTGLGVWFFLRAGSGGSAATPIVGLCAFAILAILAASRQSRVVGRMLTRSAKRKGVSRRTLIWLGLVGPFALGVGAFLLSIIAPWVWSYLGPGSILMLAAIVWLPLLAVLHWASQRMRMPILLAAVALAILFSALDWNDNHGVRRVSHGRAAQATRLEEFGHVRFDDYFLDWVRHRQERWPGEAVPVFLVSAEGGGIYAAYYTAQVLSRLQDEDERFAENVFAISGVSGGSVGAAVFCAAHQHRLERGEATSNTCGVDPDESLPEGWYQRTTHRILRQDFLSPLLSATLFPDLVQRFLPVPIGAFDRARALESGLERAASCVLGSDVMARPFDGMLGAPEGSMPVLLFNTTEVESGRRVVVAPLDLPPGLFPTLTPIQDLEPRFTAPLSTAACLSARFPLVTPAAYVMVREESDAFLQAVREAQRQARREVRRPLAEGPEFEADRAARQERALIKTLPRKRRLVDGGYFENSGIATTLNVYDAIQELAKREGLNLRIVIVRIGARDGLTRAQWQGLGESMSPLRTMLKTRGARGQDALRELYRVSTKLDLEQQPDGPGPEFAERIEFVLDVSEGYPIPLGWMLSRQACANIRDQLTRADEPGSVVPAEVEEIVAEATTETPAQASTAAEPIERVLDRADARQLQVQQQVVPRINKEGFDKVRGVLREEYRPK